MHSKVMLALLNISDLKGQFIYMLENTLRQKLLWVLWVLWEDSLVAP
jgi:hypothetical protein